VGSVVVDEAGAVAGEGATEIAPGPHAEISALRAAGERARGGTAYVTLEPCSHHGDTPPCAEALIAAGVRRVVVATEDPNPLVDGSGLRILREAGLEVSCGVGEERARELIEPFAMWVTSGRPLVTLKLAATLDGKVAAPDGTSRWITGEESRRQVHELRRRVDAVLVGAGTVVADDPALTARLPGYEGRQPLRAVLTSSGRIPPQAQIFDGGAPAAILTTNDAPEESRQAWAAAGAEVIVLPPDDGGVALPEALAALGSRGVCHVLCEGGPTLAGALVAAGLVDRVILYLAPMLVGGEAPGLLALGVKTIADAWPLQVTDVARVGEDIRVDARIGSAKEG
jgi:diaminohydroxyphosphoribosylaminopyrimidine deaminase/5-amino-6-(5-phosphoribosylamino)uracil reductase